MVAVANFVPSTNAFAFKNSWPHVPVTRVPLPGGVKVPVGDASNGLCGGMVFAVRDYFELHRPIPKTSTTPGSGPLYEYVGTRLVDSFVLPDGPVKYLDWMRLPDSDHKLPLIGIVQRGIMWHTIKLELPAIFGDIDAGRLSCLGLVCAKGLNPFDLGHNHQVLAYRYERAGSTVKLWVYDPNRPKGDDARLEFNTASPSKVTPIAFPNGSKNVRGFFRTPYVGKSPPA